MDDEDDERWNMVAAGCDISMLGPTVITHDGKDWVHIDDYRRVKRKYKERENQKEWDAETIKDLTVQVSELREQGKWSTTKKGRNTLAKRRKEFTPEDHMNENNIYAKVKKLHENNPYPPDRWDLYSENKNTVCGHVMSCVNLSHGQDKKRYWNLMAGAMVNRCWIDMRTAQDKCVQKVYKGEMVASLCRSESLKKANVLLFLKPTQKDADNKMSQIARDWGRGQRST